MRHTNPNQFLIVAATILLLAACDQPAEQNADSLAEGNSVPAASSMPEAPAVDTVTSEVQGGVNGEAAESPDDDLPPTSDVPPPSREVFADAECNFEDWVGKQVDEEAVKATGRKYRIMTPEQPATMDFNQERINVIHDDGGKVVRVFCG